jgi:hypothetical protein
VDFGQIKIKLWEITKEFCTRRFLFQPGKRIEKGTFLITVSRKTRKSFWTGTVEAHSPKSAQAQWRIDYADVRGMFDHSYALTKKEYKLTIN